VGDGRSWPVSTRLMLTSSRPTRSLIPISTWFRLHTFAVALMMGVLLTAAGCANSSLTHPSPSPTASIAIPSGDGVVVGGISVCAAVLPTHIRLPDYVAGTVIVLRGTAALVPVSSNKVKLVLPRVQVTTQMVKRHQEFRFSLPPGHYVLAVGPLRTSYFYGWVNVTVAVGKIVRSGLSCGAI